MFQLRETPPPPSRGPTMCPANHIRDPQTGQCYPVQALPISPSSPTTTPVITPATTMPFLPVSLFGPGWYKTPFGLALIAATAFVGYKLYKKKASA